MEKVQGRSYTSNHVKLLKHLNKLEIIQKGGLPSPVMFHISPCNPCNLTCSFCCFANRKMKEMLTLDQMKKAIDSFSTLGAIVPSQSARIAPVETRLTRLFDIRTLLKLLLLMNLINNMYNNQIVPVKNRYDKNNLQKVNKYLDIFRKEKYY